MKIKKLISLFGTASMVISPLSMTISCGEGSVDSENTIAMIVSTQTNPYFVDLVDSASAEAQAYGYTLDVFVSEEDQVKESQLVDNVITMGYEVLIINGMDKTPSAAAAQKAVNAGIEVIAVDRKLDEYAEVWTTVVSNNKSGAKELAEKVLSEFSSNGVSSLEMLHLQGLEGEQNGIDRWDGVQEAINGQSDVAIIKIYEARADYDLKKGQEETQTQMTAHPDIKWISADNDQMAMGAIAALGDKAGTSFVSNVIVTGFDGQDEAVQAVADGKMFGTVSQDAEELGKLSVDAAIEAWGKKDFPDIEQNKDVLVPVEVITKDNVIDFQ